MGEQTVMGKSCTCIESPGCSYRSTWTTSNWLGRADTQTHVENSAKEIDVEEPTPWTDPVYLGCTQRETKGGLSSSSSRIEWFRTLTTTGGSEGNLIANESNSSRRITARTTPQEATPINVLRIIANSEERCIFSPVKGNSVCGGSLSPPEGFEVEEELL